jgi:osmotically inducible protein OsmC
MALSHGLTQAGTPPRSLEAHVEVDFQPGTGITGIRITVSGDVPELSAEAFADAAESAKDNCPVSQALQAVPIELTVQA